MTRRAVYKNGHWVEVTAEELDAIEKRERMLSKLSQPGRVRSLIEAGWVYYHPEADH